MARLRPTERSALADRAFAYIDAAGQRRLPIHDASHVRNALARFDQVEDATDADRELAFANIKKAAEHYDVEISDNNWKDLGKPS